MEFKERMDFRQDWEDFKQVHCVFVMALNTARQISTEKHHMTHKDFITSNKRITMFKYLKRLYTYMFGLNTSLHDRASVVVHTIVLLDRLVCKGFAITLDTMHRTVFILMLISIKTQMDDVFRMPIYAKIGGLTPKICAFLELEILKILDFDVVVLGLQGESTINEISQIDIPMSSYIQPSEIIDVTILSHFFIEKTNVPKPFVSTHQELDLVCHEQIDDHNLSPIDHFYQKPTSLE